MMESKMKIALLTDSDILTSVKTSVKKHINTSLKIYLFGSRLNGTLIENDSDYLQMLADRNNTVHSYNENLAEEIYSHLHNHSRLMKSVILNIQNKISL